MHAIFTARILLNLLKVVNDDRARMMTDDKDTPLDTISGNRGQSISRRRGTTTLSSVILGVDTWFQDTQYTTTESRLDSEMTEMTDMAVWKILAWHMHMDSRILHSI